MVINPIMGGGGSNLELVNGSMMLGDGLRVTGAIYYNDENFQVAYTSKDGSTFKTVKGSLLIATTSIMGWAETDSGLEQLDTEQGVYWYKVIGDFTITFRT